MERIRLSTYVVPQNHGGIGEIARYTLGFSTVNKREWEEAERQVLENLTAKGDPLADFIRKQNKRVEEARLTSNQEDIVNFEDQIPITKKEEIFNPAIDAMRSIAIQYNIILPDIFRIHLVDSFTWEGIQTTADHINSSTITDDWEGLRLNLLHNRQSFINIGVIEEMAKDHKVEKEDLMRQMGVFSLWASLAYTELWTNPKPKEEPVTLRERTSIRRWGIKTSHPEKATSDGEISSSFLAFGFIEYLTQETLRITNTPIDEIFTHSFTGIVKTLIEEIGVQPLMDATFRKEGFRVLANALDKRYGKHAFSKIGKAIREDIDSWYNDEENFEYKKTKEFVIGKKE